MKRIAALLAASVLVAGLASGCGGGGGAEPGATQGVVDLADPGTATLVLDFQPNAVHTGLFAAQRSGYFRSAGLDLNIQEPGESSDAVKLLEAGTTQFAIMDINDLGIARERGFDPVAVAAIVQRPLAAVIARDKRLNAGTNLVERPSDLQGATVGVTGVPSDDAVLASVLRSDGLGLSDIHKVTIGFNAVPALAAGRVDAATGFWNAEGVQLRREGIPIREFRVDELGAPRYPELVLATTPQEISRRFDDVCSLLFGLGRGYAVLGNDPKGAFEDLLAENAALFRGEQASQLDALLGGGAFTSSSFAQDPSPRLDTATVLGWVRWAQQNGLIDAGRTAQDKVLNGFDLGISGRCDKARSGPQG